MTKRAEHQSSKRTLGLGVAARLDGAHERSEGHLAVLRWTQRALGGGRRRGPVALGKGPERRGKFGPVRVVILRLSGFPHRGPYARHRRSAVSRIGQGKRCSC